jgi:SAM-dependent MidA family methyltransferase
LRHATLKHLLFDTLRNTGPMTFERYMALCLYHPEFGYYTRGRERTGVEGDYFTSSDLHPVFARLVARQAKQMWEAMGCPTPFSWVEMGAGRGLFASDFLSWSSFALPDFAAALDYVVIEPGELQRGRIQARLATAGVLTKVRMLANLEELQPATGCLFSNELVDAFPVNVVTRVAGHLKEVYVIAQDDTLREKLGSLSDPGVAAYVARYAHQLEEDHRIEVNRHAQSWLQTVAAKLLSGFVVTIDYGDLAGRLFSPDRPRGTLLAYRGHIASEDFLSAPGETDLTAHVNFTALIDAGKAHGLEFEGFTTQERFLLALGEGNHFEDLYDPGQTELEKLQARLKLKRLISPEGMGNIFKVLIQRKAVGQIGLTGLKFERQELEGRG